MDNEITELTLKSNIFLIQKKKIAEKEFAKYKKFCRKNNLHFCRAESLKLFYELKKGVV